MVSFIASAKRAEKRKPPQSYLKELNAAFRADTWEAVYPFLLEEHIRRKIEGYGWWSDYKYHQECDKYYMDYGRSIDE